MDVSQGTQNSQDIMKILERFGFKFFGYNESNVALVIAPNGQVVDINTAYKFLQSQLQNANSSNQSGLESGLQLPQPIETQTSQERTLEEIERDIERIERKSESGQDKQVTHPTAQSSTSTPKIKINENVPSFFSDGYSKFETVDLDLRIPENVTKLEDFIQRNAKKENSDPLKWLSYMFQKTLQELSENSTN